MYPRYVAPRASSPSQSIRWNLQHHSTRLGSQHTYSLFSNPRTRFSSHIKPKFTLLFANRMGNTKTKQQLPALTPEEEFKQLVATTNISGQTWLELEKNLRTHIDKDIKREWAVRTQNNIHSSFHSCSCTETRGVEFLSDEEHGSAFSNCG